MANSCKMAKLVVLVLSLSLLCTPASFGQNTKPKERDARLLQLIEANVMGTHAFQILLAKKSAKGDSSCFSAGRLSDATLETLVAHQAKLLKTPISDLVSW